MDDRVKDSNCPQDEKSENGSTDAQSTPMLRPSAFHTPQPNSGPGILAPSRLGKQLGSRGFGPPPTVQGDVALTNSSSLSHNPFAAKLSALSADADGLENASQSKFVLRPSALDRQTANFNKDSSTAYKSSFKLEPAKLQSPFQQKSGKSPEPEKVKESESQEEETNTCGADGAQSEEIKQRLFGAGGATDSIAPPPESSSEKKSEGASGFVFGQNMETRVTSAKSPSNGTESSKSPADTGFVFGQKLDDRVDATPVKPDKDGDPGEEMPPGPEDEELTEKAGSEEPEKEDKEPENKESETDESKKSLVESAAMHQAKKSKPELQEVEVKTGEEDESNVFQVNVKLFVFDKENHSWLERGRGLLRVNDMCASDTQSFQSRLVMRTSGSLRVVLNTKIWPDMMIERASPKSIRVSAMDVEEGVKIYLIMANLKDADQIFTAIDSRVSQLRLHESKDEGRRAEARVPGPPDTHAHSSEKRRGEVSEEPQPATKKIRVDPEQRRDINTEESNDSSTVDPETEGDPTSSNESFTSSPTIKSSSSEA